MNGARATDYFKRRAEEERHAAEKAADQRAAQCHRELSNQYQRLAEGGEHSPADELEWIDGGIVFKEFRILP